MTIEMKTDTTLFTVSSGQAWDSLVSDVALSCGMQCVSIGSLSRFLEAANKFAGPACVFIDLNVADLSWSALHQSMLEQNLDIPVVVVAPEANLTDTVEAVKCCANLVMTLPADAAAIREAIETAIDSRKIVGHQFAVERHHRRLLTLDERERSIVDLAVDGAPNKQIANRLGLSVKTIERIRKNAYRKLNVRSTAEMTRVVILGGLHDIVSATQKPVYSAGPLASGSQLSAH